MSKQGPLGEWVSLRDYFDQRFHDLIRSIESARNELDRRLEGMNEFRLQLEHQAAAFILRTEYETRHRELDKQTTDIAERMAVSDSVQREILQRLTKSEADVKALDKGIDAIGAERAAISARAALLGVIAVLVTSAAFSTLGALILHSFSK